MFLERRHDHVASFEDEELTVPLLQQMVDGAQLSQPKLLCDSILTERFGQIRPCGQP